MIATIFNKSKPINLVLVAIIVVLSFFLKQLLDLESINFISIVKLISITLLVIFSLFTIDFIAKKNALSDQNSFVILWSSLFFILFEDGLTSYKLLLANMFVLLAFRKIISLKNEVNITQKIFDASLWLAVASILFPPAILFVILLYSSILMYASNNYKNWLIPLISFFIISLITSSFQFFFVGEINLFQFLGFQTITNLTTKEVIVFSLFGLLLLVSLFLVIPSIRLKTQKDKKSYLLLVIGLIISLGVLFFSYEVKSNLFVFSYFPLACLLSVILEKFSNTTIQSVVIYVFILLASLISFI